MKNQNIKKYFQKKALLTLDNNEYKKNVHDLFTWLLNSDKVDNDITSNNLFSAEKIVNAQIITRENITIAGLEEINYLIKSFTKLQTEFSVKDGANLNAKEIILKLEGDLKEILSFERTILNILQRLSGIATATNRIVKEIKGDKLYIAATRKTVWGDLDKKAVSLGGGLTHRLNLSDGILVKDNHLLYISPTDALQKLLNKVNNTLIEIEVEDKKNLFELIEVFNQQQSSNILAILLDNFYTDDIRKIMFEIKHQPNIIFEASGGITPENITNWMQTGVDLISLGSLTHSTKSADLSLEIT